MKYSLQFNSLLLFLARLSAQVLAVLFTAILARKLGVQGFGRFAYLGSMVFIGNTFTNFGTDTFLVRGTARAEKVTDDAPRSLSLQLFLSMLYCASLLFLRDTSLFIYSLVLFPLTVFSVNNALLRALGHFGWFWSLSLTSGLIQVLAAFLAGDVLTLCLYLLIGQIFISSLSYLICRASLSGFGIFPLKRFLPILGSILPFAALTILLVLIQRLGILFTSALLDEKTTGLFTSIFRILEGMKLGHYAILGALLPALSKGGHDTRLSFRRAFTFLMCVSFVFIILLSLYSQPVISILFGDEFLPASSLLPVLGWSLLPYTISSFISYDLIARGLEGVVVKLAFLSLLIYVILYQIWIPSLGMAGAVRSALWGEWGQGFIFTIFYLRITRFGNQVATNES